MLLRTVPTESKNRSPTLETLANPISTMNTCLPILSTLRISPPPLQLITPLSLLVKKMEVMFSETSFHLVQDLQLQLHPIWSLLQISPLQPVRKMEYQELQLQKRTFHLSDLLSSRTQVRLNSGDITDVRVRWVRRELLRRPGGEVWRIRFP